MDIRVRSAARSWTVCKYMYISEVNTLTETSVLGKRCLKHPSKVFEMKRKGIFVPSKQLEPSLPTARSTAVRHTLGILMPSHNQIQADPAAGHTHVCLSHSAEGYGNSSACTTGAAESSECPAPADVFRNVFAQQTFIASGRLEREDIFRPRTLIPDT